MKVGGRIQLETRGEIVLDWLDDGTTYGPVLGRGCIGLRSMSYSNEVSYGDLRVWKVTASQPLP